MARAVGQVEAVMTRDTNVGVQSYNLAVLNALLEADEIGQVEAVFARDTYFIGGTIVGVTILKARLKADAVGQVKFFLAFYTSLFLYF